MKENTEHWIKSLDQDASKDEEGICFRGLLIIIEELMFQTEEVDDPKWSWEVILRIEFRRFMQNLIWMVGPQKLKFHILNVSWIDRRQEIPTFLKNLASSLKKQTKSDSRRRKYLQSTFRSAEACVRV